MGIAYNTSTVRDGLVLHLDADNIKSFSGFTACNDLSGNGNDGTLVNGVNYSFDNQGCFIFDGNDDYVDSRTVGTSNPLKLSSPAGGGFTLTQPWADYRQELRDITIQESFPYNIVCPTRPE